jgi:predicted transposase/invertase (TIGR01784 family)
MNHPLIRFDWAMKRLLRQKSNFVILEGFLSVLLKDDIQIEQILESESNQESQEDKFNRVDILAQNTKKELIIIEIQNSKELDYFQRMLYGTTKVTTEYLNLGEPYRKIKKVYSVNIIYFDLGQGKDYVYHGKTEFIGIHEGDKLTLSEKQKQLFDKSEVFQIFPEYYVLKINNFNDVAKDSLDEWVYYLKNNEVPQGAQAKGLKEVQEHLQLYSLNKADQGAYYRHIDNNRLAISVLETARIEGEAAGIEKGLQQGIQQGIEQGKKEQALETARKLKQIGSLTSEQIAQITGLTIEEVEGF